MEVLQRTGERLLIEADVVRFHEVLGGGFGDVMNILFELVGVRAVESDVRLEQGLAPANRVAEGHHVLVSVETRRLPRFVLPSWECQSVFRQRILQPLDEQKALEDVLGGERDRAVEIRAAVSVEELGEARYPRACVPRR